MTPTPLTANQLQILILAEIGADLSQAGVPVSPITASTVELAGAFTQVEAQIGNLWTLYYVQGTMGSQGPRLQYLYVKIHALNILMGGTWQDVDFTDAGIDEKLSQAFKNLSSMRDDATAELALLNSQIQASGGAAVGQLTTVQPNAPCSNWQPDPNSPYYQGNPLYPGGGYNALPGGPFGPFGSGRC